MYNKEAQLLKKKAKELNINMKLTHCQELVATYHGFSNRHALLTSIADEPISANPGKDKINLQNTEWGFATPLS